MHTRSVRNVYVQCVVHPERHTQNYAKIEPL